MSRATNDRVVSEQTEFSWLSKSNAESSAQLFVVNHATLLRRCHGVAVALKQSCNGIDAALQRRCSDVVATLQRRRRDVAAT